MTVPDVRVLLDTDAYSVAVLKADTADPRFLSLIRRLRGRRPVISFQTLAEVLAGAREAGWGTRRMAALRSRLFETTVIHEDYGVIDAYAALKAECRRVGHPLHQKAHGGDRWVAAVARSKQLSLLSLDGIYDGAPGVTLLG